LGHAIAVEARLPPDLLGLFVQAIGLLKDAGLYPGWWFDHRDDDDDDGRDDEGGPSPDSDDGVRKVPEFEKA